MFSASSEHGAPSWGAVLRLDHSAKTSARGRRKPPYATGRNRESGVGTRQGLVRWYEFASAWPPGAPTEGFGPKTATPSPHRRSPVDNSRHRRRPDASGETATDTRRNPTASTVRGGQPLRAPPEMALPTAAIPPLKLREPFRGQVGAGRMSGWGPDVARPAARCLWIRSHEVISADTRGNWVIRKHRRARFCNPKNAVTYRLYTVHIGWTKVSQDNSGLAIDDGVNTSDIVPGPVAGPRQSSRLMS